MVQQSLCQRCKLRAGRPQRRLGEPLPGESYLLERREGRRKPALLWRRCLFFLTDTVYHPLTGVLTGPSLSFRCGKLDRPPPEFTCAGKPDSSVSKGVLPGTGGLVQTHRPQNPKTSHPDSPSTDAPARQTPALCRGYGEPLHKNRTSVQSWKAEELVKNATTRILKHSVPLSLYLKCTPK